MARQSFSLFCKKILGASESQEQRRQDKKAGCELPDIPAKFGRETSEHSLPSPQGWAGGQCKKTHAQGAEKWVRQSGRLQQGNPQKTTGQKTRDQSRCRWSPEGRVLQHSHQEGGVFCSRTVDLLGRSGLSKSLPLKDLRKGEHDKNNSREESHSSAQLRAHPSKSKSSKEASCKPQKNVCKQPGPQKLKRSGSLSLTRRRTERPTHQDTMP